MRQKANTDEVFSDAIQGAREVDWDSEAKHILKAELARGGMTYKTLVKRLEAMGIDDSETAIANRISRGKFPFTFFLQCMRAIGVGQVDLRDRASHK
jgi:3-mercaptopyruvate sulfurtransferase SseA